MSPHPALAGRTAVVTGATGGIGQVLTRELLRGGAVVIAVARDPRRAAALAASVPGAADRLEVVTGDLSTRVGITAVAETIRARHDAVHLLVNNAGAHFPDHRLSADGMEMHVAVDYLAAIGMTTLLAEPLRRGRARVVDVVSDSIRDTRLVKGPGRPRPATVEPADLDDLRRLNPREGFTPMQAYARAKLLTVIAGRHLAGDPRQVGVTVTAVHPGLVATGIVDDVTPSLLRPLRPLIRAFLRSPADGAAAVLRVATDPSLAGVTGAYFVREQIVPPPPAALNRDLQQLLAAATRRFFAGT